MKILLLKGQLSRIKKIYEADKVGITGQQCLKLILRVKKMYEAKSLMLKILRLVIKREELESSKTPDQLVLSGLTGRILSLIDILQDEHRVFKRPFIIQGMDYVQRLRDEYTKLNKEFFDHFQVDFESI